MGCSVGPCTFKTCGETVTGSSTLVMAGVALEKGIPKGRGVELPARDSGRAAVTPPS